MGEDELPDLGGLRTHRGTDDDGEVRVDGEGEGPPAGAAIPVGNIGRVPRHEVGNAFGHGRIIRKEEGKRKGFVGGHSLPPGPNVSPS